MDALWQDIKYGARMLLKNRGVTLIAILTLALGIGANSAIFSVVNAILLRPLPYPEPERLVFLSEWSKQVPGMSISLANFNDWREMNKSFEAMVAYRTQNMILSGSGEAERVQARQVTWGLFPTLKIQPIVGRPMAPEEDKVGAERVVLLGEGFWTRRFARDPQIVNKTLTLDGESYTIIGVLPTSGFHSTWRQFDIFTSLWRLEDKLGGPNNRGNHPGMYAFARLKPGVTVKQAEAEMKGIARQLEQQYPNSNTGNSIEVQPLLEAIVGDVSGSVWLLMGAVGFVLLIACANVANLLMARATTRVKEIAVRTALGAGRMRLIRQLLTESMLLAVIGGGLGVLIAVWATDALVKAAPANIPRIQDVSVDRVVLFFTFALSLVTGLFFGIFPALQAARTDVHETLKEGGRGGGAGVGRRRARAALVVGEVAVSLVLLVGAGLMLRSLYNVLSADPGINPRGVLSANVSLPALKSDTEEKRRAFTLQAVERLKAIPGVEYAAFKNPLLGGWQTAFVIEGRPTPKLGEVPSTDYSRITPDALKVMGTRLIRGREFTEHDNEKSELVCMIDETFASSHFAGQDPIGQRIATGGIPQPGQTPRWMKVVGIVQHVKHYGVDQPSRVEMYQPQAQNPGGSGNFILRTSLDPASLGSQLRAAVLSVDSEVPAYNIRTLLSIAEDATAQRRLSVILLSGFAGLALLLAAVGLYGVMSYSVTQRSHEIGIRMALGANRPAILQMVVRQGMKLALIGVGLGLAAALGCAQLIKAQLFQVTATDPPTYSSVPFILAAVALLACWIPARRATKVDPMVALRYE